MSLVQWLFALLIIFICGFLMLVVLLQRGRGGGLAGAFGGAGGTAAFGAKTGDVFTWVTVVVAAVFLLVCVLGNYAFDMSPRPVTTAEVSSQEVPPSGAIPIGETIPIKIEPGEDGTSAVTITPIEPPTSEPAAGGEATPPATTPAEGSPSEPPADAEPGKPEQGEQTGDQSPKPEPAPAEGAPDTPKQEDKGPGQP